MANDVGYISITVLTAAPATGSAGYVSTTTLQAAPATGSAGYIRTTLLYQPPSPNSAQFISSTSLAASTIPGRAGFVTYTALVAAPALFTLDPLILVVSEAGGDPITITGSFPTTTPITVEVLALDGTSLGFAFGQIGDGADIIPTATSLTFSLPPLALGHYNLLFTQTLSAAVTTETRPFHVIRRSYSNVLFNLRRQQAEPRAVGPRDIRQAPVSKTP